MNAPVPALETGGRVAAPVIETGGRVAPIIPRTFEDVQRIAKIVVAAGLAPKGMEKMEKVAVAIMHGLEVGLTPMAALQRIAVVNGRPTVWGDGAIGLVRASGLCELIRETVAGEGDEMVATCEAHRRGEPEPIIRTFSVADAKRAGLWGKSGPWQQYPARMLQMRARAFALRDGFADVLGGLYLKEEMDDGPPPRPARPPRSEPELSPPPDVIDVEPEPEPEPDPPPPEAEDIVAAAAARFAAATSLAELDESYRAVVEAAGDFPPDRDAIERLYAEHQARLRSSKPPRERQKLSEMSPAQQAGINCGNQAFRLFLVEVEKAPSEALDDTGAAAAFVREFCGVASRAEFASNPEGLRRWNTLMQRFLDWKNSPPPPTE